MSFEVTVTPTVYDVEVAVNQSVQPFDVEVTVGNVPDLDLTTNGDSGASTFDSLTGELNIPNYTLDGLGGVPESRTLTINGTTQDLSANRTFTIPAPDPVTIGSPANGLAIDGNQVLTIGLASGSQAGALSSTDWSTFNNKQNAIGYTPENVANKAINFTSPDDTKYPTTLAVSTALAGKQDLLTNPITGTGVAGQVSFWTGTGTQSGDNGLFWDNSTKNFRINQSTDAGFRLDVNGTARVQGDVTFGTIGTGSGFSWDNTNNRLALRGISSPVGALDINTGSSTLFNISSQLDGSISFGNIASTSQVPTILGKSLNLTGLTLFGLASNSNTSGDLVLSVRERTNNDFTTLTNKAFIFRRFASDLVTILRNGSVGILTSPNASALMDLSSTTKGFLPPRMTGAQAEAISSPAEGLLVYSTDGTGTTITSKGWWGFDGSTWAQLN